MGICRCRLRTGLFCHRHDQAVCPACVVDKHHTVCNACSCRPFFFFVCFSSSDSRFLRASAASLPTWSGCKSRTGRKMTLYRRTTIRPFCATGCPFVAKREPPTKQLWSPPIYTSRSTAPAARGANTASTFRAWRPWRGSVRGSWLKSTAGGGGT